MPNSSIPTGIAPQYGSGWSFQVTDNSIDELINNKAKLLVIDYSKSGAEADRYSKSETDVLHQNGKELISYLSIGEAEDYRYYYQSNWKSNPPSWLGKENPDWPGNAKVQYWNPEWQQYMIGYLDKIIDSGFDGVYLDIIDGFEYWSDPRNGEGLVLNRADAANRMIDFVEKLTEHARVTRGKPNFYIIPQNAEDLLPYDTSGKFLREISGVGVEDLFYEGTRPQSAASIAERSANLDKITAAGKPVLVIDYVNDTSGYQGANKTRVDDFWTKTLLAGYTPQVSFTNSSILGEDPINQLKIASGNTAVPLPAVNQTPVTTVAPVITTTATPINISPVAAPTPVEIVSPSTSTLPITPVAAPTPVAIASTPITPVAAPMPVDVAPTAPPVPVAIPIPVITAELNVLEVMPPIVLPVMPTPVTTAPVIYTPPVIVPVAVPIAAPLDITNLNPEIVENSGFNRRDRQRGYSSRECITDQNSPDLAESDILTGTDQVVNLTGDNTSDIITCDLESETFDTIGLEADSANIFSHRSGFNVADGFTARREELDDLMEPGRNSCHNFREDSGALQPKSLILACSDPMI